MGALFFYLVFKMDDKEKAEIPILNHTFPKIRSLTLPESRTSLRRSWKVRVSSSTMNVPVQIMSIRVLAWLRFPTVKSDSEEQHGHHIGCQAVEDFERHSVGMCLLPEYIGEGDGQHATAEKGGRL